MATSRINGRGDEKRTVVVVQRRLRHEWQVTPIGRARAQFFSNLELAVGYAQLWGAIHRPSIVRVLADGGGIEEESLSTDVRINASAPTAQPPSCLARPVVLHAGGQNIRRCQSG
jgi:hypothetical protein